MELAKSLVDLNDPVKLPEAVRLLEVRRGIEKEDAGAYEALARAYHGLGRIAEADLATALKHTARGENKEAVMFAKRAQIRLPAGGTAWHKADDIIKIEPEKQE